MITRRRRISRTGLVLASMFALTACGGTTSPQRVPADEYRRRLRADVPVRLTAAGVKPSTLHLFNGLQATLVNEDTAVRSVSIDAARSDQPGCAALTIVLQPGERRTTDLLLLRRLSTSGTRSGPGRRRFRWWSRTRKEKAR